MTARSGAGISVLSSPYSGTGTRERSALADLLARLSEALLTRSLAEFAEESLARAEQHGSNTSASPRTPDQMFSNAEHLVNRQWASSLLRWAAPEQPAESLGASPRSVAPDRLAPYAEQMNVALQAELDVLLDNLPAALRDDVLLRARAPRVSQ